MDALDPRHGSPRGFHAHRRDGEPPCQPCRDAVNTYERRRRKTRTLYGVRWEIPATGTTRRIRALHWMGWRGTDIAARIGGVDQTRISQLASGKQTHVLRDTAAAIERVYEELCMTRGPSIITRKRALAAGWTSPLAWDCIDTDPEPRGLRLVREPKVTLDEAVVLRLLAGERVRSTKAEKDEAMRRWKAMGRSEKSLCQIHGWHDGRYDRRQEAS